VVVVVVVVIMTITMMMIIKEYEAEPSNLEKKRQHLGKRKREVKKI
jgi:hypothetical protein